MALTATMFRIQIELSDVDRGVYDEIELRAAQHPSESDAYFVTRVLAMALEHRDGMRFGRGISVPDDPALFVSDDTGAYVLWVEIGQPSADRLHKVTKLCEQVSVYTHKDPTPILESLAAGEVFRGEEVTVVELEPAFIDQLAAVLTRNSRWSVLRSEGVLYVTVDDETFQTTPIVHGP